MSLKQLRSLALGAVCSLLLLFLALRHVDFHALAGTVERADRRFVLLMFVGSLLTIWLRAERWRLLLPGRDQPRGAMFRLSTVGLAVNNVLPMRLGQLARAFLAAKEFKLPLLTVLASILIERLLDALTILSFFMIAAAINRDSVWAATMLPLLAPLYAGVLGGFLFSFAFEWFLEKNTRLSALLKGWPRLHGLVDQLILGLKPLRSPIVLAPVLLWSVALWMGDGLNYFLAFRAVSLPNTLTYSYAFIVEATAGMSTVLPTAPGYIGAFEYAVSRALIPMGVSAESAFGCAFLLHMVSYLFVTALGIYFLYKEGTTLGDIWKTSAERGRDKT